MGSINLPKKTRHVQIKPKTHPMYAPSPSVPGRALPITALSWLHVALNRIPSPAVKVIPNCSPPTPTLPPSRTPPRSKHEVPTPQTASEHSLKSSPKHNEETKPKIQLRTTHARQTPLRRLPTSEHTFPNPQIVSLESLAIHLLSKIRSTAAAQWQLTWPRVSPTSPSYPNPRNVVS